MRRLAVGFACLLWAAAALAQSDVVVDDAAEFARIDATRARETALLDAAETACYQRFLVNACVNAVQSERRAMQANLRRQEAALHERAFAAQGAERLRAAQQRALERAQQDAEQQAREPNDPAADRLQAQAQKQAEHATRAVAAPPAAVASTAVGTGPSAAEQAVNRENFARKQADAEQKRQDIAKRLAETQDKSAAPLPLPQ